MVSKSRRSGDELVSVTRGFLLTSCFLFYVYNITQGIKKYVRIPYSPGNSFDKVTDDILKKWTSSESVNASEYNVEIKQADGGNVEWPISLSNTEDLALATNSRCILKVSAIIRHKDDPPIILNQVNQASFNESEVSAGEVTPSSAEQPRFVVTPSRKRSPTKKLPAEGTWWWPFFLRYSCSQQNPRVCSRVASSCLQASSHDGRNACWLQKQVEQGVC
jgi:hypothetical protein